MKPATRRLGRGLGAFLDFGPSGDDAPGYVPEAAGSETKSVLETSQPPAERPLVAPTPPAPRSVPVAPVATQAAPPMPPAAPLVGARFEPGQAAPPDVAEQAFVDEIVGGLTFPDVDLE